MIANIHTAKTNLSKLIERAEAGEEVVIARNGKPAVRLQPVATAGSGQSRAIFGALKGEVVFAVDYDSADPQIEAMFDESLDRPRDVPLKLDADA